MNAADYRSATEPYNYQRQELLDTFDRPAWGLLWEQGLGKSKLAVDTANLLYLDHKIDGVLVVAPSGVHLNWAYDEIAKHTPPDLRWAAVAYQSHKATTKKHQHQLQVLFGSSGLAWMCISYDGFMTKQGHKAVCEMMDRRRLLYVLDESHNIKTAASKRSQSVRRSAKFGEYRRILTGTPVSVGPFDVYPQVDFLDQNFWRAHGFPDFATFKSYFGEFQPQWNPQINPRTGEPYGEFQACVGYRHLDVLQRMLAEITSRKTKDECLPDLPQKRYARRYIELNDEQRRMYRQLRDEFITFLASGDVIAPDLVITRMLRLQQILSGFVTDDAGQIRVLEGRNHRVDAVLDIVEQAQRKVVVWARFQHDIDLICAALTEAGVKWARYDGQVGPAERAEGKARFEDETSDTKVMVASQQAASTGHTWVVADTVVYYTNSFKFIDRTQSEDRVHRIGQRCSPLYIDLEAPGTIDRHIINNLRGKFDIATQITGDLAKAWLEE